MEPINAVLGLILLCCLAILLLWNVLQWSLLRWRAVVIEGCIVDRQHVHVAGYGVDRYYLIYSYSFGGRAYKHKTKVDEETYHIWSEGDAVKVRCFPAFAYVARLDE